MLPVSAVGALDCIGQLLIIGLYQLVLFVAAIKVVVGLALGAGHRKLEVGYLYGKGILSQSLLERL